MILPKTVAEAPTLEAAFEAYRKTPGARSARWNGNLTFSKFRRAFGKAFEQKETPSDVITGLLEALLAFSTGATQPVAAAPAPAPQPKDAERSVKPENQLLPPTKGQVWKLRMAALDAGVSGPWRCPMFRGQASDLIKQVVEAGNDKQAIRRILQA